VTDRIPSSLSIAEPLWSGQTQFIGSREDPAPDKSWFVGIGGFAVDAPHDTVVVLLLAEDVAQLRNLADAAARGWLAVQDELAVAYEAIESRDAELAYLRKELRRADLRREQDRQKIAELRHPALNPASPLPHPEGEQ
jgi:hypothetical protein